MTHYFEKTIVDAKTIYTDYLINSIAPTLYHGFKQIYRDAIDMENEYIEGEKFNPQIVNPGVLQIFQYYLMGLNKWSDNMAEEETQRIRNESGCADIFDDLIKATIKSHIIVLTYTASKKTCKIVQEKLHEKVESKFFIHSCYLECARIFVDHPNLFYHQYSNSELKENERKIYQLIKIGIKNGIKRVLPMRKILTEYLNNDYIENNDSAEEEYTKVKDLLAKEKYGFDDDEGGNMRLVETTESSVENNFVELENGVVDFASLIYGIKPDDTIIEEEKVHIFEQNKDISNIANSFVLPNVGNNENNENDKQNDVQQILSNLAPKTENQYQNQTGGAILSAAKTDLAKTDLIEVIPDVALEVAPEVALNKIATEVVNDNDIHNDAHNEIEDIFGKVSKKSKKNSVLSDAFKAAKINDDAGSIDLDNEINIVKNLKMESKNNDNYFNGIAGI